MNTSSDIVKVLLSLYPRLSSSSTVKGVGRMFYLASPADTSFPDLDSTPGYVAQATPYFLGMIVLELVVKRLQGEGVRMTDGLMSVVHGMISLLME